MPDNEKSTDVTALAVQLLSAYLSNNSVASEHLADLIKTTRAALVEEAIEEAPQAEVHAPAVSVRKSLSSSEHLLSLIDGKPYKTLKRHLAANGLTPDSYRKRYNLPASYPMVAPAFAAKRREIAERIGLGNRGSAERAVAAQASDPAAGATQIGGITAGAMPLAEKSGGKVTAKEPGKAQKRKAASKSRTADVKGETEIVDELGARAVQTEGKGAATAKRAARSKPAASPSKAGAEAAAPDAGAKAQSTTKDTKGAKVKAAKVPEDEIIQAAPEARSAGRKKASAKDGQTTPKPGASKKPATRTISSDKNAETIAVPVGTSVERPENAKDQGTAPATTPEVPKPPKARRKLRLFKGEAAAQPEAQPEASVGAGSSTSSPKPSRGRRMARQTPRS